MGYYRGVDTLALHIIVVYRIAMERYRVRVGAVAEYRAYMGYYSSYMCLYRRCVRHLGGVIENVCFYLGIMRGVCTFAGVMGAIGSAL